jgi:hypothetical protein
MGIDVPSSLRQRPLVRGLAVPYNAPRAADGSYRFADVDMPRQRACIEGRRCNVCGHTLADAAVFIIPSTDVEVCGRRVIASTAQGPICQPCTDYSVAACPFLGDNLPRSRGARPPQTEVWISSTDYRFLREGDVTVVLIDAPFRRVRRLERHPLLRAHGAARPVGQSEGAP